MEPRKTERLRGSSTENFALGNAAGSYGYYLHDTTNPLLLQEVGIGGAGGGNGVMEIRSGVVTSQDWLTINRSDDPKHGFHAVALGRHAKCAG